MNEKGESSSSPQIFPNEVGYAPVTPAKVGQPDPSQIWRNWLGNPFEEVVYEDTSVRSSFNCYDSYFGSTSQTYENTGGIFNMFSMDDVETWNSISCRDLLALADSTIRNSSGDGGAGVRNGFDSQTQQYGRVNVLCDLNSPPQMVSDPLINTGLSLQFTPVTPDVTKRAEKEHALPDINGSTLVEANQDSEKGLAEQTNQNETPQQKPKRRKHRPKVVREGKPKKARTPATPKPATPKTDGSSTGKRKYVRRKGVEKSPATPAVDEVNGVTHSTPDQKVKRTCKRKINFDESEKHAEATADKTCKMASEGVESYQKVDEAESPNPITPNKTELPKGRSKRNYTKAKCKIDFVQETCDKRPPSHVPGSNESRYCTNVCGNKGAQAHRSKGDTSSDIDSIKLLQEQTLAVNHDSLESFLSVYTDFNCVNKEAPPLSIINKGKAPETSNDRYMLTYGQHFRNKQLVVRESVSSGGYQQQHTNKKTKKNSMVPSFYHGHIGYNPTLRSEIDLLVYRLECLHIGSNVVVPYTTGYHEKNALVVYQQDRSVVPYEGLFDPVKKRKQRPKVDLDDETNRVWMLLLENINSQGVDGTDEQKVKWWEEERRVFRGRVDSFIARMHLVQGDRRFSRWKGSVLDSVVGVFLTQNVSDHLSSSAFMSLAARYPLKPNKSSEPLPKELYQVEEPVDHGRMMLQEVNSSVEKEAVNSNGYSRNCASIVDLNENSDSATCKESVLSHTEVEDIASSQNSADTCCIHKSQEPDKCNATAGGYTSFVELLHMQSKVIPKNSEKCASEESGISAESAVQATVQMLNTISSQESASSNSVSKASGSNNVVEASGETVQKVIDPHRKEKSGKAKVKVNWDKLRSDAELKPKTERPADAMDSMDYDAIRKADVNDVADAIKERGMNNRLAERIKKMLDRLVEDHGSTDLEWLRDVPPDQAKEYLLSFRGLGLKSVECIRLLTLHHLAFPVDTNVGRIAVRLGWVPLQPLPESLQLHLLELYPVQETIQKYLWPRLCKLDQRTLYELHYQMITFGKVFCTKTKPNCNACPLRGECRHFASAFASARLALPAPDQGIARLTENRTGQSSIGMIDLPSGSEQPKQQSEVQNRNPVIEEMAPSGPMVEVPATPGFIVEVPSTPGGPGPMVQVPATPGSIVEVPATTSTEPIVEVPASPEPEQVQQEVYDIEDWSADEEIPTIKLNIEAFTQNLQTYLETHMELGECDMSKALVAITTEAASIPAPKLKNVNQLRTEHQVYELPDSHPLLEGLERREPDDPCSYLLAIWTPGETADSIEPPEGQCRSQESGTLCNEETCFFCNSTREANSQTVRGTLLIPCRTAMRGSFPLNGTYFQVNEVFADHDSSLNPIAVPRAWLWNLPRRTVYFGTSIPSIFKGLTTEEIQLCFWRGFVCVRGFDQKTRAPRPLMARLHFPVSRLKKPKAAEEKEKLTQ